MSAVASMGEGQDGEALDRLVTVIVVSFHSAAVIADCLACLPPELRVIVVDNGSRDDSVARARAARPCADIIALDRNEGFGRACNIGLRLTRTPFAFLLNPDCTLTERSLRDLIATARAHPAFAILGPAGEGGEETDSEPRLEAVKEVVGAGMLLRMESLKTIGLFDENLFLFGEDNEMCARARDHGAGVGRVHGVSMRHLIASSSAVEGYCPDLRERLMGQSASYSAIKRRGPLVGRLLCARKLAIYLIKTAQFSVSGQPADRARMAARARGTLDVLTGGKAVLFKNPLALRPRDPVSTAAGAVGEAS